MVLKNPYALLGSNCSIKILVLGWMLVTLVYSHMYYGGIMCNVLSISYAQNLA